MSTRSSPIVSYACPDGTLLETVFDPDKVSTALAVGNPDGEMSLMDHFDLPDGSQVVPYSPTNNLLATGCVLLPSGLGEVGQKAELLSAIRAYLSRYVDLSPSFAELASYYVLLTWVYDAFNELGYLRFRGDFGTGKTRALLAVGSICYKPFFASGASTVSPIFHILDAFRGTLVLDEADFRFSDMTGELTKILNNGNVDGIPVLRTMANRHRELNPQAFRVFGPKLVAMRHSFADRALESRFLTEETGRRSLPPHIPLHTPAELRHEAQALRNRLLTWRLHARHTIELQPNPIDGASGRINQTALALLSLVHEPEERDRLAACILGASGAPWKPIETPETGVVTATLRAIAQSERPFVPIADIVSYYNESALARGQAPATNKWIGSILRIRLGIPTTKSHGIYGIYQNERDRLNTLADRLGIPDTGTTDDRRPVAGATEIDASSSGAEPESIERAA